MTLNRSDYAVRKRTAPGPTWDSSERVIFSVAFDDRPECLFEFSKSDQEGWVLHLHECGRTIGIDPLREAFFPLSKITARYWHGSFRIQWGDADRVWFEMAAETS